MKLKCKIEKCGHVIDTTGMEPLSVPVVMVKHVQERHMKKGYEALQAITAYLSTYFFEPVALPPVSGDAQVQVVETNLQQVEQYSTARKTLLQGFKEWAKGGVR